jgi:hypothetical protein
MLKQFYYMGVAIQVLGYHGERILIRYSNGKPVWVGAEYVT